MRAKKMKMLSGRVGAAVLCVALLLAAVNADLLLGSLFAPQLSADDGQSTTVYTFESDAALGDFDMWYAPTLTPDREVPAIGNASANWYVNKGTLTFRRNNALFLNSSALLYADDDLTEDFKVYKYNTAINTAALQENQFNAPTVTEGPLPVADDVTVQNKNGNENASRDLGYLDFVGGFYNKDVTHTLTHKQAVTDFMLEVDMLIGTAQNAGVKGVMIAPAGEFAFAADGNVHNDKGIYITMGSNMLPAVVGAIDADTATVTVGDTFTDRTRWPMTQEPLKSADTAVCADTAFGTLAVDYKAVSPDHDTEVAQAGKVTLCIEVKDGTLRVWNKAAKDVNVLTVSLTADYAGGCVSYVASSTFHGAFCGLRLKDYVNGNSEKTWDYGYSVTRGEKIVQKAVSSETFGEVEIPALDLLNPVPQNSATVPVAVDTVRKNVTYKTVADAAVYTNYGIAVLNTRTYNGFTLEVDVSSAAHRVMLGFGADNTSLGVFPSQRGWALLIENNGTVQLIGKASGAAVWQTYASGAVGDYTAKNVHHYALQVEQNGLVTVTVDGARVLQHDLSAATEGYIYLAANQEGDCFSGLEITDLATAGAAETYTFDTVEELDAFTMWYMPVGRATQAVPAIRVERVTPHGNWYVENNTLRFMHDDYLYHTPSQLVAGVDMTVETEAGEQEITYKSTEDETALTGNFGIAMLNVRQYTDFRLEVDVTAGAHRSYIGFGAAGGSYGAHVGQSGGGYAFHTQPYCDTENTGLAVISSYNALAGGQYALARSDAFAYDTTKSHHYVIEVKNGVVTASVDGEAVTVKTVLPMYEGGYIYLATNGEGGGFYNLKITAPLPAAEQLPTDISNTVTYTFDKQSDLDAFESWYVYGAADNGKPAIPVSEEDGANWYIDREQTLSFRQNKLYVKEDAETKTITASKELTIGGETKTYDFTEQSGYPTYNGNFGIAMLKTEYENFILEVDMKPTTRHIYVGFGAKGGHYGVFRTHVDGGWVLRINKDGSNDAARVIVGHYTGQWFANDATAQVTPFPYSEGSYRHLRLVVTDGVAYYYFDEQETPVTVNLGDAYEGGHIYFAVNSKDGGFDNISITDLDKKEIVIGGLTETPSEEVPTIDRAAGASLSDVLSGPVNVVDVNGYGYRVPVKWASDTYRSYIGGEHAFTLKAGASGWHNIRVEPRTDSPTIVVNNLLNEAGYDAAVSRQYYFDHDNDLLDFIACSSQEQSDGTMSGWDGVLLPDADHSGWTTASGALTNTSPTNPGNWTAENRTAISALFLKDLHLYNYRVEMDYYHAKGNWWYTYLICGAQDISHSYISRKNDTVVYTATESGGNAACGIWTWVEQEGRIHQAGDVYNSNNYQTTQLNYIEDVDGSMYMDHYAETRNNKHHITIEVVNGEAWLQVDDSGKYYFIPNVEALGGYLGVATHGNGSVIDNLRITALNESGEQVALDTAKQGFAPTQENTYNGWDPTGDTFEWGSEYRR